MFLGVLGFLGFIVFGIMAFVSLIRKSGKAKRNFIITGVCFLLFIVGAVNSSGSGGVDKAKKDNEAVEVNKKDKEDPVVEEVSKDEEEEKKEDRSIDVAIEEDNDKVDKATLKDGLLTIEHQPGTLWDESSLFHTVYDLFEVMPTAFKDDSVEEVEAIVKTTMVDNKGNESVETVIEYIYTRESFEELNYDKFSEMAYGEQWRILNESDLYIIHPGIYQNLKEKYTDNLINGNSKLPPVE